MTSQFEFGTQFTYLGGVFTIGSIYEATDTIYIKDSEGKTSSMSFADFKSFVRHGIYRILPKTK